MFARRSSAAPHDDLQHTPSSPERADVWEEPSSFWSSFRSGPVLSRILLLFAPLVVVGFFVVWFLGAEPPQSPPAAPQPVKRVAEAKAEVREPASTLRLPPPPVRQEVAEVKPTTMPEPAPVPAVADVPAAPLSTDEIKVLQGKLGALGFGAGPIDGVLGPQTEAAVRRYAQSRGLASSDATREVLSRLEAEASAKR